MSNTEKSVKGQNISTLTGRLARDPSLWVPKDSNKERAVIFRMLHRTGRDPNKLMAISVAAYGPKTIDEALKLRKGSLVTVSGSLGYGSPRVIDVGEGKDPVVVPQHQIRPSDNKGYIEFHYHSQRYLDTLKNGETNEPTIMSTDEIDEAFEMLESDDPIFTDEE